MLTVMYFLNLRFSDRIRVKGLYTLHAVHLKDFELKSRVEV